MRENFSKYFNRKKIIITGHTGFKGSWLTLWLNNIGASIVGISKNNHGKKSHFSDLKIKKKMKSYFFDIKDIKKLRRVIEDFKPNYIFHLAGQSMVKESYINPYSTFLTNSLGTLNILEITRNLKQRCNLIIITSDKVYKNYEIQRGYKENDELGGKDPYSASKTAAESIISSYISLNSNNKIKIAVARAGNVIGGGDWNKNRLIPDCAKAWGNKRKVIIRNPYSTRPWQNVLDVIRGYLILAVNLNTNKKVNGQIFNFGPQQRENFTVLEIVKFMKQYWHNVNWTVKKNSNKKIIESKLLKLNSSKAKKILGWKCKMNLKKSLKITTDWYKEYYKSRTGRNLISLKTLEKFQKYKK